MHLPSQFAAIAPVSPDARLALLITEHDDLDAAIAALALGGGCDDLTITRLKKRKLQLKDEIAALTTAAPRMAHAS